MSKGWKRAGGALLAFSINAAYADDDTAARIAELQKMLEQQQQQMKAMAEELKSLQQARVDDKSKSTGNPVFANFKNGIVFEDASGDWQLAINGRVQADARAFHPDESGADTFSVRRARLGATMTFYKDYSARIEGEYAGTSTNPSTTLTYAYFDINKFGTAKIRLGQFKPFYGLERAMSTNFIDFQERSLADALLGATYDRGIMVHGTPVKGLYYNASWINGKGASSSGNGDETNSEYDNKDTLLRLTGNLAEFAGWKDAVVHVGGFYAFGKQESGSATASISTEARGYNVFSTDTFTKAVDRKRSGIELALANGPVKLQSEYIAAKFDGHGFDERELSAWYASVNWLVTGETFASTYKEGAFGRLTPKRPFRFGGDGWGALQVGVRYSKLDGSDFTTANAVGTGKLAANRSNEADAWTLGANWIFNPNVRFIANYVHTSFDTPVTVNSKTYDDEDAITMRAQFDF